MAPTSALSIALALAIALAHGATCEEEASSCGGELPQALYQDDHEGAHLGLLQTKAAALRQAAAAAEAAAEAGAEGGPFGQWMAKMQEQAQAAQAAQAAQQPPSPPPPSGPPPSPAGAPSPGGAPAAAGGHSFLLDAINDALAQNVTTKLNEMLPVVIKNKGKDPIATVVKTKKIVVTNLSGMSGMTISSLKLAKMDVTLDGTGLAGHATLSLSAAVPSMNGQIGRHGMLGMEQSFQLSVGGTSVNLGVSGTVQLGANHSLALTAVQVPGVQVSFQSMQVVGGDGPRYVERILNRGLEQGKPKIQDKLSKKLQKSMQAAFNKLLPIPLHVKMSPGQ